MSGGVPSWGMRPIPTPNMETLSGRTTPNDFNRERDRLTPRAGSASGRTFSSETRSMNPTCPAIFIPGTTMTKEDVDLLETRYESQLADSRAHIIELDEQVHEQGQLIRDLTHELERFRGREETSIHEQRGMSAQRMELASQNESLQTLLDSCEKELIEKEKSVDKLKLQNRELADLLEQTRGNLEAETSEANLLRTEVQRLDFEISESKLQLDHAAGVQRSHDLYKATHDKFTKEGSLSSQLASSVDLLKTELQDAEQRIIDIEKTRIREIQSIHKSQVSLIDTISEIMRSVRELSSNAVDTPTERVTGDEEWLKNVQSMREALQFIDVAAPTPYLKKIASLTAHGNLSGVDLVTLKEEIEAIQRSQQTGAPPPEFLNSANNGIRQVLSAARDSLLLCKRELQHTASQQVVNNKKVMELDDEIRRVKSKHAPLLNQLHRLGDQLNKHQQEAGAKSVLLEREKQYTRELQDATDAFGKEEAELQQKLSDAHQENKKMKSFMAKLQIADVPQLHTLLATAASSTQPTPASN